MSTAELQIHEPYNDIKAELAKLSEENDKAVFDYEDPKGNKMARSHIYSLRHVKSSIEKKRKELKADALEYGRKVDAVAKELAGQVVAMIEVHEAPLKAIEQREEDRKAAIQSAIDVIEQASNNIPDNPTSGDVQAALDAVHAIEIDADVYQERMAEATNLKQVAVKSLEAAFEKLKADEAEKAELERLRREKEERERKEREEQIAREAAEKATRRAEEQAQREREDAERKAQAEREEAARREREAIERAERAEREAKEAEARAREQAEREAREAEEKRRREEIDRKLAEEKRAANKRHCAKVMGEASKAIDLLLQSEHDADQIVQAIASGEVPHTTINF